MIEFGTPFGLPAERNDDAHLIGVDDPGFGVTDLQSRLDTRARPATLEDFTSLRRPVSARRRPPPQVAAFDPPPLDVRRQKGHERFDVAADGGVESPLNAFCVGVGRHGFTRSTSGSGSVGSVSRSVMPRLSAEAWRT
jgi:hypothetical protein